MQEYIDRCRLCIPANELVVGMRYCVWDLRAGHQIMQWTGKFFKGLTYEWGQYIPHGFIHYDLDDKFGTVFPQFPIITA
jgi:hypothetical protein